MTLKARVKAGRLVVDEPTDLPEGTEVELLPLDPGDWLDDEDRAALHKALQDSEEDLKAGRPVVPGGRRMYLTKVAAHLSYTFADARVIVRALWGARRERGPRL